jgi:PadR family transcriptional regulator PadR
MIVSMASSPKLSHTAALILHTIGVGYGYGFSIMEVTGFASGTVYPAVRRLERDNLIRSRWEKQSIADEAQRPPRKYYTITSDGRVILRVMRERYPLLERSIPSTKVEHA